MTNTVKRLDNLILYIFVIAIIFVSANPLFHILRHQESVIALFCFSLFSVVSIYMVKKKNIMLNKNALIFFIILIFCMTCTIILNLVPLGSYIAILLQLVVALIFTSIYEKEAFQNVYINIMVVLSIMSLVFFCLGEVFPTFVAMLPCDEGKYVDYYHVFFTHIYLVIKGVGTNIISRNTGMCWEPGCYQMFINMALFFVLTNSKEKEKNRLYVYDTIIILLFIITIITTKSTTGICICTFILIANGKSIFKKYNKKRAVLLFCLLIIGIIFVISNSITSGIVEESLYKINGAEYMGGEGITQRLSLNKLDYLFYGGMTSIFGISFETLYSIPNHNIWNSILEDAIALGWIFVSSILIGLYKFSKLFPKSLVLYSALILSLCAESLMHSCFIFVLVFFGIKGNVKGNLHETINRK